MKLRSVTAGFLPLLVHAAALGVAGYALAQIIRGGRVVNFAAWFVGAAVLHDLVLLPSYSLLDRLAHARSGRRAARRVAVINHVRVPALISGVLLLVCFPLILGLSDHNYVAAAGHHPSGYARDWAEITAVLFAGSALLYAIRVIRAKR